MQTVDNEAVQGEMKRGEGVAEMSKRNGLKLIRRLKTSPRLNMVGYTTKKYSLAG